MMDSSVSEIIFCLFLLFFYMDHSKSFFKFTTFTSYKYSHLGNLQYSTPTHIIYSSATVAHTTYNTFNTYTYTIIGY